MTDSIQTLGVTYRNSIANAMMNGLLFDGPDPVAPMGLGGLVRDSFCNGRLYATVCAHGGLTGIGYWGRQNLGAANFFKGDAESAWVKLFRVRVRIGEKDYYLTLNGKALPAGSRKVGWETRQGAAMECPYDPATRSFTLSLAQPGATRLEVVNEF